MSNYDNLKDPTQEMVGGDLTGLAVPLVLLGSHMLVPSKKTAKCIYSQVRSMKSSRKMGGDGNPESGKLINLNSLAKTGGGGLIDIALPALLMTANHLYKRGRRTNKKFYRPKRFSRRRR
jgi:hypothetical protein